MRPETISFSTLCGQRCERLISVKTYTKVMPTEYSTPSLIVTGVSGALQPGHRRTWILLQLGQFSSGFGEVDDDGLRQGWRGEEQSLENDLVMSD